MFQSKFFFLIMATHKLFFVDMFSWLTYVDNEQSCAEGHLGPHGEL